MYQIAMESVLKVPELYEIKILMQGPCSPLFISFESASGDIEQSVKTDF